MMNGTRNVKENYSALFWKGESGVMEDSATADWSQHLVELSCWRLAKTIPTLTVVAQEVFTSPDVHEQ